MRPQFSLRAAFVLIAVVAAALGAYRWIELKVREIERRAFADYVINGTVVDPETLRGNGLFSDEELDALKAERGKFFAAIGKRDPSP